MVKLSDITDKKPLLYTIVAGLALLTAVLVYGILVTPARQPYRDALTQFHNVDKALAVSNVSPNTSDSTDKELTDAVASIKTRLTSLKTENAALGKMTVLTTGEGKTLYAAYSRNIDAYISYNTSVLDSIAKVVPVIHTCASNSAAVTESTEGATVLRACAKQYRSVSNVPDADYQVLAKTFADLYDKKAEVFEKTAALADPTGTDATTKANLDSQLNDIADDESAASTTFSENVSASRKQFLVNDTAKKLETWLKAHSRIFA